MALFPTGSSGSVNVSDIYPGMASGNSGRPDTIAATGPNQGSVANPSARTVAPGKEPAVAWLGLLLAFVAWRVITEYQSK